MEASKVFENFLLSEFKKVFETPFEPSFKLSKNSYDYDIIAFSKKHKKIFLIEAKYKDLPPSSMSGFNLINHVLNGKKGLIEESEKHKLRKEYFIKNINKFSEIANCDLSKYEINMIIVTKYTPLIKRYGDIEIISFESLRKRIESFA